MIPPVALSRSELLQIDHYRNTLTPTTIGGDGGNGPADDGSGGTGRKGEGGSRQGGDLGDKQGRGTSRFGSAFKPQNWKASKKWRKKQVVGEQQEFNTRVPSYDIPVVEGVDEEAEGADATFKDELVLLASYGDDGTWRKALDKLLQAEHQEQEEVTKERMARLDEWRQTSH
jgi:hypothetical protein